MRGLLALRAKAAGFIYIGDSLTFAIVKLQYRYVDFEIEVSRRLLFNNRCNLPSKVFRNYQ